MPLLDYLLSLVLDDQKKIIFKNYHNQKSKTKHILKLISNLRDFRHIQ